MPYPLTTPSSDQVGVLHLGQAPCFVSYLGVNTTGTTSYPVIGTSAVPSGYQPVILSLALSNSQASAGVTVQLQDTSSTPIVSGTFAMGADSIIVLPETPRGWFTGAAGAGINIVTNTINNIGVTAAWCLFARATP